jgi:hypothetical protein
LTVNVNGSDAGRLGLGEVEGHDVVCFQRIRKVCLPPMNIM